MLKKILALFLILLVFSGQLVSVSAQNVSQYPTFCFTAIRCDDPKSGCSGNGISVHRARLTIDTTDPDNKPLPNSKVYVIMSISSGNAQYYTSGNTGVDSIDEYLTYSIPSDLGYEFQGLFAEDGITPINQTKYNTLTTDRNGDLYSIDGIALPAMEWQDYTPLPGHDRKWFGFSIPEPEPDGDPGLGLGAQQQAEILKIDWEHATKDCLELAWDPDGVVFDSQSLEPVPGASVTLLKKRDNGTFSFVNKFDPNDVPTGVLTNPYLTIENGGFSFFVPDGTYKLMPQIAGYNFPSALALNSNYLKMYSNIYPMMTGVEIVEKGGPQHRDIPIDSASGQPTYFPIKIIEYSYQSDRISSVFIDGKVSHPLATINAYSVIPDPNNLDAKVRYKLIKTIQADKVGRFSLTINQLNFDKTKSEMFGEIEAIKANFNSTSTDTSPAPFVLKLNPILTYIEGKASYKGQILPGAKIELLLNSSTKPFYTTVADSQGYFKVSSDYIPFIPYKLRYSSGAVVASVTTSKFLTDNSTSIIDSDTNLFYPRYSNPKINESIKKSIAAYNNQLNTNNDSNQGGTSANNQNQSGLTKNQSDSNKLTFIGIVLVIVILLVGLGTIGVYLIKKHQNNS